MKEIYDKFEAEVISFNLQEVRMEIILGSRSDGEDNVWEDDWGESASLGIEEDGTEVLN